MLLRRPPTLTDRVALVVVLPALFAAATIVSVEAWRARRVIVPAPPVADTLADALESRSVERAFARLAAGEDPNRPLLFRHPALTGGGLVAATPLQIAAAKRDGDMVMMLLSFGARAELPQNRVAACVAEAMGEPAIADLIRAAGGGKLVCAEVPVGAPVLTGRGPAPD